MGMFIRDSLVRGFRQEKENMFGLMELNTKVNL